MGTTTPLIPRNGPRPQTAFSNLAHSSQPARQAYTDLRSCQVGQDYTGKAACEAADYCCPTNGKSIGWINQCFRKDPSCCVNTTATIFPRLSNGPTGRGPTARGLHSSWRRTLKNSHTEKASLS